MHRQHWLPFYNSRDKNKLHFEFAKTTYTAISLVGLAYECAAAKEILGIGPIGQYNCC